jgi:AcrR family transcriptional regulator
MTTEATMARTVDATAHERRRTQFLDAAARLLESRGYEQMSIQNVLAETGASRGAFYHYFTAKADLLAAIVDRLVDAVAELLEPVVSDRDLPAAAKLRRVFAVLSAPRGRDGQAIVVTLRVWYSDGNVLVRQRFRTAIIDRLASMLAAVVEQGRNEGVFVVPQADSAALIVATLVQDLHDMLADKYFAVESRPDATTVEPIVQAHLWAIERVLGLTGDSTPLIDTGTLLA